MQRWEYMHAALSYEEEAKLWVLGKPDYRQTGSLSDLLNPFGSAGWELIALVPELYSTDSVGSPTGTILASQVEVFRALFKRLMPV